MTELKRSCNTCKHNPVADVGQYPCNECRRDTLPKYEAKVIKEMAKEEAIKFLELEKESTKTLWDSVNHEGGREYFEKSLEVIDMAIKALEQQPCDDCISRAYIESIVEELENICINGDEYILSLLSNIKNAPSVTPQQKTGHWEDCSNGWMCSNCYKDVSHESDFCPHCGADMRGEDED